jgi:diguanylate cyclase (GGDEF)-like protein/PAS domain S-box-containing protein
MLALTLLLGVGRLLPSTRFFTNPADYLPLHTLLEFVSMAVSAMVFAMAWNLRYRNVNNHTILLGTGFLAVGLIDLAHTLSYAGMPEFITRSGPEKAINFWLAGRGIAALVLLSVAVLPARRWSTSINLAALLFSLALVVLIYWVGLLHSDRLPRTFIPDQGLTPFKIAFEYGLSALFFLSAVVLLTKYRAESSSELQWLAAGAWVHGLAELFFTLYSDVTDVFNLLGHVYKAIAYLMVYRALFVAGVLRPYRELDEERARLHGLISAIPDLLWLKTPDGRYQGCNASFAQFFGVSDTDIIGKTDFDLAGPELAESFRLHDRYAMQSQAFVTHEETLSFAADGYRGTFEMTRTPMFGPDGQLIAILGIGRDITRRKQAELVQQIRVATLNRLAGNHGLNDVLHHIALELETLRPEMRVSILLKNLDDGLLYTAASPSLPDFYNKAVNGLRPGFGRGSCGTACATGETVIVEDVATHPHWADYTEIAARAGLRACWSIPFKDEHEDVLGTFGVYYSECRAPDPDDLDLIDEFAKLAGLAVQRVRSETALRQAAAVIASTREGVMITDMTPAIVAVNRAFTEITGYQEEEVLGRNPGMLKSGRYDPSFYQSMWAAIRETGHWQGEIWNRRKSGEVYPQLITISTVTDKHGNATHFAAVMTDISQLKRSQSELQKLAHFDPLTGLPNRLLVQSRLQHAVEHAKRERKQVAVMFIDLDRFKNVNDSLGHPAGDELLSLVATRLRQRVRDDDTLGRWGGDEFLLVLESIQRPEDVAGLAQTIIQLVETPFVLPSGHTVYVGASIGISWYPDDGQTVTELIQHADVAMYQAKEQGRNTLRFYTPALTRAANERLDTEARLRRGLAKNEFVLHYQPQVDVATGKLTGCEALVRWNDPDRGLIPPDRFIPVAEEIGLIVPLGEWVLRTACGQAQAWRTAGLPELVMAVNLSARQLDQKDLVSGTASILARTGLPPGLLKLELTESMIMTRGNDAIDLLLGLKNLGVWLSIDDFGTGYSSLAYLKRFPIDELKIDRGFVRDIPQDKSDMEIAATVIAMAKGLRLKVVAEGVETAEQLSFLSQQGCNTYQGYFHSHPLPAEQFTELLRQA